MAMVLSAPGQMHKNLAKIAPPRPDARLMTGIASAALELATWFWLLQSAAALIKTHKAFRLFTAHRHWLDKRAPRPEPKEVGLIIAVKGVSENFEDFLDFAFTQDYPNYQIVFTVASENDPAHAVIADRLAKGGPVPARLIVAGEARNTGQKVHNQIAALESLEDSCALLAFADADLSGCGDWLSCLVLPLNLGQADFTTGYRWFIPANQNLPNRIPALIGAGIEPFIGPNWRMCLWGGSMAMTREVCDELEIVKNLAGSINDDARISQLARQAGKRMRYVRSVAALSPVDFTWKSLWEFGRRQYFQLRIYQPLLWWMALLIPLCYLTGFCVCLTRLAMGDFYMLVPLGIAVLLNLARTRVRRRYLHARLGPILDEALRGSGWLDPVVHFVHLVIIASSACGREIVWAGIRYRVTGPQQTEIRVPSPEVTASQSH
jgi:ceramide glucosyltransferase